MYTQSFWQPQGTPNSETHASKPCMDVPCPVTGKKLRLRDLTPVKFTPASDGADNSYVDPVSNDMLANSSRLVVIKPTGDVMLEKTYRTCIKPDGVYKGASLSNDYYPLEDLVIPYIMCDCVCMRFSHAVLRLLTFLITGTSQCRPQCEGEGYHQVGDRGNWICW
jgi:hypothetical protein